MFKICNCNSFPKKKKKILLTKDNMTNLHHLIFLNLTNSSRSKSLTISSRNILTVIRSRMNFSQDFCPFIAHKLPFLTLKMARLADTLRLFVEFLLLLLLAGWLLPSNGKFTKMHFSPVQCLLLLFLI